MDTAMQDAFRMGWLVARQARLDQQISAAQQRERRLLETMKQQLTIDILECQITLMQKRYDDATIATRSDISFEPVRQSLQIALTRLNRTYDEANNRRARRCGALSKRRSIVGRIVNVLAS